MYSLQQVNTNRPEVIPDEDAHVDIIDGILVTADELKMLTAHHCGSPNLPGGYYSLKTRDGKVFAFVAEWDLDFFVDSHPEIISWVLFGGVAVEHKKR
jgi:hypothetical protein